MKKASKIIHLGRKHEPMSEKPEVKKDEHSYPDVHLSPDSEIPFPKGHFMARVKLKVKNSSKSEDETGKARHTYHLEVHGIHPDFEGAEEKADSEGAEDKTDAAAALMESMGRARNKKEADYTPET